MIKPSGQHEFASTQWSVVLRAADSADSGARSALEALCRQYWLPLYAFARRQVADQHDCAGTWKRSSATKLP
jgi:RNA polymerase sigma-70 factor (ECF subfamily)